MRPAPESTLPVDEGLVSWRLGFFVQFALIIGVFIASWLCLHNCAEIGSFAARYHEELGDRPLPKATTWVVEYRTVFLFGALFFPLAALATFALHDRSLAFSVLLGLGLFAILEAIAVYEFLRLPLVVTMKQLGSG